MNDKEKESDTEPFLFGKHEGLSPEKIVEDDPEWLVWAYENIKTRRAYGFPICSKTLYLAAKDKIEDPEEDHYEDLINH